MEDNYYRSGNVYDISNKYEQEDFYIESVEATLARAYVPFQKADKIYPPSQALSHGTVFPDLYQPEFS
ncbi:MAG: spore coat associated protein CotJA [Clostridiales bacterium]|nr:spore coat associated protein CotJA [Clostridiales bacterium]